MGTIIFPCERCGSTRIGGRCDCPDSKVIELVECPYCGVHSQRGSANAGMCGDCITRLNREATISLSSPTNRSEGGGEP